MAEVHAEIEYTKPNGEGVHSDICPPDHDSKNMNDAEWRTFLHNCLDEWINNSNGTGIFWVGSSSRIKDH